MNATITEQDVRLLQLFGALADTYTADTPDSRTVLSRMTGEPGKFGLFVDITLRDLRAVRALAGRLAEGP